MTQYLIISAVGGLEGVHPDRESAEGYAKELREIGERCIVTPFETGGRELSAHVKNIQTALRRKENPRCDES